MVKVTWDYTSHAATYDRRAEYAAEAIDYIVEKAGVGAGARVADIGSGTGKLAKRLLERGLRVSAVEPNDAMRAFGIQNTAGGTIEWSVGTGESTGLPSASFRLVSFGSSFNVVDRSAALREARRIAVPRGFFTCMWNHRDLDDPVQAAVEGVIRARVPEFSLGVRREDQTSVLEESGLFASVEQRSFGFTASIERTDYLSAWESHATLARQAGPRFAEVLREIGRVVPSQPLLAVPYHTAIWIAQFEE